MGNNILKCDALVVTISWLVFSQGSSPRVEMGTWIEIVSSCLVMVLFKGRYNPFCVPLFPKLEQRSTSDSVWVGFWSLGGGGHLYSTRLSAFFHKKSITNEIRLLLMSSHHKKASESFIFRRMYKNTAKDGTVGKNSKQPKKDLGSEKSNIRNGKTITQLQASNWLKNNRNAPKK